MVFTIYHVHYIMFNDYESVTPIDTSHRMACHDGFDIFSYANFTVITTVTRTVYHNNNMESVLYGMLNQHVKSNK